MAKYAIGIDYGTLSARALIAEVGSGRELGEAVYEYRHAVMDETLPSGIKLKPDWALEHPDDYLEALSVTVPAAMKNAGVSKDDVIGIGIDFTACTMVAVDKNGDPLCWKYPDNPHAYVKLWKHHAAQDQANRLNAIAEERNEKFLARYGGKISSEWMFPKIWQVVEEDPDLYDEIDRFMEAGDWVIMRMTGVEARNSCMAGYKAIWHKQDGYPSKEFFKACHPKLENVVEEKLNTKIYPIGSKAGELTEEMAEKMGLNPGVAVAVANVDAHVSLPPAGLTKKGQMLMIMGTSTCHIMLGDEEHIVPGMCGVVEDGVIPALMGYEAGQSCVGDHFNWFADNCVPEDYMIKAREKGMNAHQYLTSLCENQKPGENGLLALDWWNGNRSVLVDVDLTGMIMGMTLTTKPEDMYRALIEATAYGTRVIVDTFEKSGVEIEGLYACGGISQKNPFLMQVYADVLKREIRIARSTQTPALGSAMFGAVAAGADKGGYDSIEDAANEMGGTLPIVYKPIPAHSAIYDKLYTEYRRLHDYFGRGANDVMKRLKEIKKDQNA
ncbi:MAG: ribulokinase [Clostridia bacterium]|nr:ribulokinase [Clostridia bacterium]